MRRSFLLSVSALLVFGLAGTAGANPMNWAGTTTLLLGDFPREKSAQELQGGGVATVNGSGGFGGHLNTLRLAPSRGGISGNFVQFVTDPDQAGNSIAAIRYRNIRGGTGTFAPISGAAASSSTLTQNTLPSRGTVRLCLLTANCKSGFLDLDLSSTLNGVGVGVGGLLTIGVAEDNPIKISIQGAPWTIKTVTIQDHITTTGKVNTKIIPVTLKGFAHDPASGTTNTATPSGVVQLVTPSQVETNLPLGSNDKVAGGQTLRIHFIPEPGLLLLLGSGVAGLALLGRKRLRK